MKFCLLAFCKQHNEIFESQSGSKRDRRVEKGLVSRGFDCQAKRGFKLDAVLQEMEDQGREDPLADLVKTVDLVKWEKLVKKCTS